MGKGVCGQSSPQDLSMKINGRFGDMYGGIVEKEMATHSIILAWRIPWIGEPGRLQSMGLQESDMTW